MWDRKCAKRLGRSGVLVFVLFLCVSGAILPNCSIVSTTLPTADASINVSCTSVVFSNVTVQGNMTLNISISGILAANPGSPNVTVTVSGMTVQTGATLAIDSRGYTAAPGVPTVSIMIQSLIGNDGCLVFLGSFPAGTEILVSGAQMKASTASAPKLAALDLSNPTWCKMVMLVAVSLTGSSMIFTDTSLVASNPTSFVIEAFYMTGTAPMTFSDGSALMLQNCSLWTSNGNTVYLSNSATFTRSSYLALTSCNMTAARWAFYMNGTATFNGSSYLALDSCTMTAGGGYNAFVMNSLLTVSFSSYLALSSCNMTTGLAGGGYVFYTKSAATFTSASYLALSSCTLTAGGTGGAFRMTGVTFTSSSYLAATSCNMTAIGGATKGDTFLLTVPVSFTGSSFLALDSCSITAAAGVGGGWSSFVIDSASFTKLSYLAVTSCTLLGYRLAVYVGTMTVDGWSYVIVTNSSFTGTTSSSFPPVTLGWSSPLVIGNSSWVLWKGNTMNSPPGYTSCIRNSIAFTSTSTTPGVISILDNTCSCVSGCSMWTATSVIVGGGGKIYHRCNKVNTVPAGASLLPTGAVSVGACGSCKASADCFGPLTQTNSMCGLKSTNLDSIVLVCQCLPGGARGNLCLPGPYESESKSLTPAISTTPTKTPPLSSTTVSPIATRSLSLCPAGTYSTAGSGSCTVCPAGYYGTTAGGNCIACAAGTFGPGGTTTCSPCPNGTYSDAAAAACLPCPSDLNASTPCSTAMYWASGTTMNWTNAFDYCASINGSLPSILSAAQNTALVTAIGGLRAWTSGTRLVPYSSNSSQFQWVTNRSSPGMVLHSGITASTGYCSQVFCNFLSGEPNDNTNEQCVEINYNGLGKWNDRSCSGSLKVACVLPVCPAGSYIAGGSQICIRCPAGTYNSFPGQVNLSSCISCSPGTYSGVGASICTLCPVGKYSTTNGSSSCTDCPVGTFNPTPGQKNASSCNPCPAGTYSTAGSGSCTICPAGYYGTTAGGSCIACVAGTFGPGGTTPCSPCPNGTYSDAAAGACLPCPSDLDASTPCSTAMYWASGVSMNWTNAFDYCASLNGSLPSMLSAAQTIVLLAVSGGQRAWTSGTRLVPYSSNSSQFQWVTNTSSTGMPFYDGITD